MHRAYQMSHIRYKIIIIVKKILYFSVQQIETKIIIKKSN